MAAELLNMAAALLEVADAGSITPEVIQKGASGRGIFRLRCADGRSVVGINNDGAREENADFVRIAKFLAENGVPVPRVLAENQTRCLTEDLGSRDLTELVQSSTWQQSRIYYQSALDGLKILQHIPTSLPFTIERQFDYETYLWEQNYFFEHLWHTHLEHHTEPNRSAFDAIARELSQTLPCLVHRDFQSQNLMIAGGGVKFIDFQGMRPGQPEYDLASLLMDPYAGLSESQRDELIDYWISIGGSYDPDRYLKCAMQRLMQALGAFANIAHNLGNAWYLQHIDPASRDLEKVLAKLKLASLDL